MNKIVPGKIKVPKQSVLSIFIRLMAVIFLFVIPAYIYFQNISEIFGISQIFLIAASFVVGLIFGFVYSHFAKNDEVVMPDQSIIR